VVEGPEYKVFQGSDKIVQVGPNLVLVLSSEDSPTKVDIPNEERSDLKVYIKKNRLSTETDQR
jgi:hypothetical protein